MKMRPVVLIPEFKHNFWGGDKLQKLFRKPCGNTVTSESFELSCDTAGLSKIDDVLCPMTLIETLKKYGWRDCIGTLWDNTEEFPLLVKLIDANKDVAIHVHPTEEYAKIKGDKKSQTQMWYMLDCEPEAYIYYGLKQGIAKEDFIKLAESKVITAVLNRIPVKKGDYFLIQPGTIHALGAGCMAVQIQQSSDSGYCIFDYDRKDDEGKPAELQINEAAETINLLPSKKVISLGHIAKTKDFTVDRFNATTTFEVDNKSFMNLMCLNGESNLTWGRGHMPIKKGDSIFIPAGTGKYSLSGTASGLKISL